MENIEIEFDDIELLTEVVDYYKQIYKIDCKVIESGTKKSSIHIECDFQRYINPIFELGTLIGMSWVKENCKLQFREWFDVTRKTIHINGSIYDTEIEFLGEFGEVNKINLSRLVSSESRIDILKPYINKSDYEKLASKNKFTKRQNWNPLNDYSQDGDNLSYIITESYLLIFSSKSNRAIILESIWSINSISL